MTSQKVNCFSSPSSHTRSGRTKTAMTLRSASWRTINAGRLHVRRAKNGTPSVHPLQGDEIRALRRLQREQGGIVACVLDRTSWADDAQVVPRAVRSDRGVGQDAVLGASAHA